MPAVDEASTDRQRRRLFGASNKSAMTCVKIIRPPTLDISSMTAHCSEPRRKQLVTCSNTTRDRNARDAGDDWAYNQSVGYRAVRAAQRGWTRARCIAAAIRVRYADFDTPKLRN
jgi:hypothetical protein